MFRKESGDWKRYRSLIGLIEIDFHYSDYGRDYTPYRQAMNNVHDEAVEALQQAYEQSKRYVLYTRLVNIASRKNYRSFAGSAADEKP